MQNNGLVATTVNSDGTSWAGVRIKPVQEWSITNTLTF